MSRRRMEEELERDIQEHIAMETEDNIARGMSPAEARHVALRKFGNVARVKEDTRSVWAWAALDTWLADLRHALRRIRRSPGPPAVAVLSLALAFAPSVTVFSIMDRLFLSAVPVNKPEEILQLNFRDTRPHAQFQSQELSYPEFQEARGGLRSFSGVTYRYGKFAMAMLRGGRAMLCVNAVSENYFDVLGIPIRIGPGFRAGRQSLILSHSFWFREFDGRSDAIGRALLLNGVAYTIDGVAPPDFHGPDRVLTPDVWISLETGLDAQRERANLSRRDIRSGETWARLRPGVSPAAANAEVERFARNLARDWPATNRDLIGYTRAPLAQRDSSGLTLTAIAIAIFAILIAVACANVAGILLARAEERRHETAVRQTLGASRARLMREWMVESAVLSCLAAGFGLAGARLLNAGLLATLPSFPVPIHLEFSFGPHVWWYAVALAVIATGAFGLVPAWRASHPDLLSSLHRDSAVRVFQVRVPFRSILVVAQITAAELLLFGAGLTLETISAVDRVEPGFDPSRPIAVADVLVTTDDAALRPVDCDAIRDRLARIPGVRRVVYTRNMPMSGSIGASRQLELPGQEPREIRGGAVGPGFLTTIGTRFLAGRDLQAADAHSVIVDSVLARQLDPAGAVIGREIRLDGALRQIVGVFQNPKWNDIYEAPRPRAIALAPPQSGGDTRVAIEVEGDPAAYLARLRAEIAAAQPGAGATSAKTLAQHYRDGLFIQRSVIRLFYGLGAIALLLTLGGLHGILRALFVRRSREFAIRLALGAPPERLVATILASGLKLALCGLALGLAIGVPIAVYIASNTHGFSPWSPAALGLSSAGVIAAALIAVAQPAARVLRIAPGDVIRSE